MITAIFLKILEKDNVGADCLCKVHIVLLYLVSINYFEAKLATLNTGILLNRYSKLIKLLSLSFESLPALPEALRGECI
jgi:hypothetical protein